MNLKEQVKSLLLENDSLLEELQKVKASKRLLLLEIQQLKGEVERYKFDHLTGLMGRIDFEEEFNSLFNTGEDFIFSILDINNLHTINRKSGYAAGDSLIKRVSKFLKHLYPSSYIYRIGGDEFAIVCTKTSNEEFNRIILSSEIQEELTFGSISVQSLLENKSNLSSTDVFKYVDKLVISKKLLNKKGRRSSDLESK